MAAPAQKISRTAIFAALPPPLSVDDFEFYKVDGGYRLFFIGRDQFSPKTCARPLFDESVGPILNVQHNRKAPLFNVDHEAFKDVTTVANFHKVEQLLGVPSDARMFNFASTKATEVSMGLLHTLRPGVATFHSLLTRTAHEKVVFVSVSSSFSRYVHHAVHNNQWPATPPLNPVLGSRYLREAFEIHNWGKIIDGRTVFEDESSLAIERIQIPPSLHPSAVVFLAPNPATSGKKIPNWPNEIAQKLANERPTA